MSLSILFLTQCVGHIWIKFIRTFIDENQLDSLNGVLVNVLTLGKHIDTEHQVEFQMNLSYPQKTDYQKTKVYFTKLYGTRIFQLSCKH